MLDPDDRDIRWLGIDIDVRPGSYRVVTSVISCPLRTVLPNAIPHMRCLPEVPCQPSTIRSLGNIDDRIVWQTNLIEVGGRVRAGDLT